MKRPKQSVFFGWRGREVALHPDEIYPDDDPLVRDNPQLFEDVKLKSSTPVVEQATAAPGEKRTTRG